MGKRQLKKWALTVPWLLFQEAGSLFHLVGLLQQTQATQRDPSLSHTARRTGGSETPDDCLFVMEITLCLQQTDNDLILHQTQTRVRLYWTHLDSDLGLSGWLGSWEMSDPRSEWVEEEAARPEDDAFHPPHMQPHTVLYKWVITPHFLDSGLRAELIFPSPPTHEHTCTAHAHELTGLQRHLRWEGNIVKRQGRSDKERRENKNEVCRDQNRPAARNRRSNKLLCTMDVT